MLGLFFYILAVIKNILAVVKKDFVDVAHIHKLYFIVLLSNILLSTMTITKLSFLITSAHCKMDYCYLSNS